RLSCLSSPTRLPAPPLFPYTTLFRSSRILFDGLRACGVAYRAAGEERQVLAGQEVILAAGALQSPQLLQLSGIGSAQLLREHGIDRKSTRLNSSHRTISYAVFCLKKK